MSSPNVAKALANLMAQLRRQTPQRRVAMANDLHQQLTNMQSEVAAEKRRAVRELRETGLTLGEVAAVLGVSISRVKQMEEGRSSKQRPDAVADIA